MLVFTNVAGELVDPLAVIAGALRSVFTVQVAISAVLLAVLMLTVVDLLVGLDFVVLDILEAIGMMVVSCVVDGFDVGTLDTEVVV